MVNASADIGTRRMGRVVQRLFEIETYKTMSMLGFARVGEMRPDMGALEERLTHLISNMPGGSVAAEDTLDDLLEISAKLEGMVARSSYRFGATSAYEQIVKQRITVLREERFNGRQTFGEFMMRRYDPAMRTVRSTKDRLDAMSDRAMRAGELLRTRVDVERSAQNRGFAGEHEQAGGLAVAPAAHGRGAVGGGDQLLRGVAGGVSAVPADRADGAV